MTRYDVLWFSKFRAAFLNPSVLYMGHLCGQSSVERPFAELRVECRPLKAPVGACTDASAVPDLYFAGGVDALERVFTGLVPDLRSGE
eukprot:986056-Pyramimonas_sp.AAC.2